jgi:hypothetical protein
MKRMLALVVLLMTVCWNASSQVPVRTPCKSVIKHCAPNKDGTMTCIAETAVLSGIVGPTESNLFAIAADDGTWSVLVTQNKQ